MIKIKNKKGITLIALVITIIVLIILTAVTLNLVLGDNGLIDRAKEASFKQKFTSMEEEVKLYYAGKRVFIEENAPIEELLPIIGNRIRYRY